MPKRRRRSRRTGSVHQLAERAKELIREHQRAGTDFLKEHLHVSFSRASRIKAVLVRQGFIKRPSTVHGKWLLEGKTLTGKTGKPGTVNPPVGNAHQHPKPPTAPSKPVGARENTHDGEHVSADAARLLTFRKHLEDVLSGVRSPALQLLERCAGNLYRYATILKVLEEN